MIIPATLEELASYVEKGKSIFFFTADWCGDCTFIKPVMPEIEAAYPDFRFVEVNRDRFMEVATAWTIFGIPSFVAIEDGTEVGRLVNKNRKTKDEILTFLSKLPNH